MVGVLNQFMTLCKSDDQVALLDVQSLSDKSGGLRKPRVGHRNVKRLADQRGDLVLKSLPFFIGHWQVGRVGADPQG